MLGRATSGGIIALAEGDMITQIDQRMMKRDAHRLDTVGECEQFRIIDQRHRTHPENKNDPRASRAGAIPENKNDSSAKALESGC